MSIIHFNTNTQVYLICYSWEEYSLIKGRVHIAQAIRITIPYISSYETIYANTWGLLFFYNPSVDLNTRNKNLVHADSIT